MVLRGLTIDKKPLKDHMEAVGHKEAFDFVKDLVKDHVPLSESIIKQIHYLVLADKWSYVKKKYKLNITNFLYA